MAALGGLSPAAVLRRQTPEAWREPSFAARARATVSRHVRHYPDPSPNSTRYTSAVSARVLLVEDEPGLVLTLTDRLTAEGYRVESVTNGNVALERASGEAFDVILLDVMLPGRDGFDVCRTLRQRGVSAPIMMLTARGQVVDRVVGLRLGADDYLTKPFEMMELLARVEALLRRAPQSAPTVDRAVPVRTRCAWTSARPKWRRTA